MKLPRNSRFLIQKRRWRFVFLCLICLAALHGQDIIKNPALPESGRLLPLKELLRIPDSGKGYFFKLPWGLQAAEDGTIYVKDGINLYRFFPNGDFDRNLIREGQGPGEIQGELTDFLLEGREIILFCSNLKKTLKLDETGNVLEEFILPERASHLIAYYKNRYCFTDVKFQPFEGKEGPNTIENNLIVTDGKGGIIRGQCSFPTLRYLRLRTFGDGRSSISSRSITTLQVTPVYGTHLFVVHTQEYAVKRIDLDKLAVDRIFKRDYPRVKYPKNGELDKPSAFDRYNDVFRILVHGGRVWALTSRFDPQKGILVDVFSPRGDYEENFFLPLLNSKTGDEFSQLYFPVAAGGDFIYALEHDKDWNFSVAKYEIEERGAKPGER